ncbi:MAG: glycoside hydrolase family 43 protein [Hungatella sp.]|nr:glycoside hydrolase family 43 protein [Hungatella sp.]
MIQNPILKGFCPDPCIIRAGEDFYIAVSTFEWWPGVRIYHSKDLKHWEQIPSPLRRQSQLDMTGDPTSGGVWAPCLSNDGKRFWLVYTDVKTKKGMYYNTHNYLVWTEDIYGDWSEPVYLNSVGFDPSLFHDTDGKKYLINMLNGFKGITVQQYDPVSQKLTGPVKTVFCGTEAGYTEGPHMYHIGEWYYLLTAEGGTGYEHQVTAARSKSVWGPFEAGEENPVVTSDRSDPGSLQKAGHGSLVDTGHGEWYLAHLCARARTTEEGKQVCLTGRETALQKVCFQDGKLQMADGRKTARLETEEPAGIAPHPLKPAADRDDFDSPVLGRRYTSPRVPLNEKASLQKRPGWLRLYGQESLNSLHHVSLLAVRQQEPHAMAELSMEFEPDRYEQLAGLAYMYDAMNFYIFGKSRLETGETVLRMVGSDTGVCKYLWEDIPIPSQGPITLRAETDLAGAWVTFSYSLKDGTFHQAGPRLTTEILTDEHCRGFTGAHFAMYCHDMTGSGKHADFDYFTYHDYLIKH